MRRLLVSGLTGYAAMVIAQAHLNTRNQSRVLAAWERHLDSGLSRSGRWL